MKLSGLLLLVPLASARAVRYHNQIPIVEETVNDHTSAEELDATPSIGVHFTTLQAVAAARYPNGTTIDLAQIPGDAEYIDLMSRWMTPHSTLNSPDDSTILTTFLSKVHTTLETELNHPVTNITSAITFPFYGSHEKDFQNALLSAGLAPSEDTPPIHSEAYATHAGLQHASCASATLPYQYQHILVLAFDSSSFSASMHETTCSPTATPQSRMINYAARTDLGWWNLPVYEAPRAKFWAKLQEAVVHAVAGLGVPPGKIVLLGSHGQDAEFMGVVEQALWRELEVDVGALLGGRREEGGEWLPARGAAALGLRNQNRR
ncbi:hypothetical protein BKA58DRAFT_392131 [Alternaria rosae]|uniref:uncharacterized protein n=1 Tax=Alternaria rosae TaxID=1187941 RepID=UPI001E8D2F6D|nr:uncharacterized protein BKA58DRAFT_395252 [Alternaria rosae]XP_046021206.1 uncharacterized protein BKA58DRAFT_392131 [Alternaria rosae]KAH6851597.1 hypothetical protein BKA58DRAFT_395252 [Alternaria rosae]KAH6860778.1 hypothetical protein BKA58DRAFT_392131 [Alternaria rosae]